MDAPRHIVDESKQRPWVLAASPALWAVHFMLSYVTAAVWCAKAGTGAPAAPARVAVAAYTALALGAIGWIGWRGWRRHRLGGEALPHDDDRPEDRTRFLGFATAILSALSAVAVVYAALVAALIRTCH